MEIVSPIRKEEGVETKFVDNADKATQALHDGWVCIGTMGRYLVFMREEAKTSDDDVVTLNLSARTLNLLRHNRITTVGQLRKMSDADLLKIYNFGKSCLREVRVRLQGIDS